MLFSYRGSIERKSGEPISQQLVPDAPVARLRIELRVSGGDLVYDAKAELPFSPPLGSSHAQSLVALEEVVRAVASNIDGSRKIAEQRDADSLAIKTQLEATSVAGEGDVEKRVVAQETSSFEPHTFAGGPVLQVSDITAAPTGNTSSALLSFVLMLGGACVFLGILALAVTRWSTFGQGGQLGVLTAFTGATFASGVILGRRGFARSGFTLELLSLELLWAVAYMGFDGGTFDEQGWAFAAFFIALAHGAFSVWRRSIAASVSSCLALTTAVILLCANHSSHSPVGLVAVSGAFALLLSAVGYVAARFESPAMSGPYRVAGALFGFASAVGTTILLSSNTTPGGLCFELCWPYVLLAFAWFAAPSHRAAPGSVVIAPLANVDARLPRSSTWGDRRDSFVATCSLTIGAILPSVQALVLGLTAQPYWCAAVTLAPLSFAIAWGVSRWLPEHRPVALLGSLAASAWLLFSAGAALSTFAATSDVLSAAWPFVVVALAWAGSNWAPTGEGGWVGQPLRVVRSLVLLTAPSFEILAGSLGDKRVWPLGAMLVATSGGVLVLVDRFFERASRSRLLFAMVVSMWVLLTSAYAIVDLHREISLVAVVWPFAAAAFSWLLSLAVVRDEGTTSHSIAARSLRLSTLLLLLLAPSLEAIASDFSDSAWWVRGFVALLGTGLGAVVIALATKPTSSNEVDPAPAAPSRWSLAVAGVGGLWALATTRDAFAQIEMQHGYISVATAWPYAMALTALLVGIVVDSTTRRPGYGYRQVALVIACGAASWMALIAENRVGFLIVSVVVGFASVFLTTIDPDSQRTAPTPSFRGDVGVLFGIGCAATAVTVTCLRRCFGADLWNGASSDMAMGPVGYLVVFLVTVFGLFLLVEALPVLPKPLARGLEVTLSSLFFGVVGILSLPTLERDMTYMTILFAGGTAIVVLGLAKRRIVLVGFASVAITIELFVEYFAKLHGHVHWGLLALGFGVALLMLAVLFERKVKPLLPALARWS